MVRDGADGGDGARSETTVLCDRNEIFLKAFPGWQHFETRRDWNVWEKPVFLDVDITVSEICTLLHVAALFPTNTTMDNSVSGTCSINGLIAALAVV